MVRLVKIVQVSDAHGVETCRKASVECAGAVVWVTYQLIVAASPYVRARFGLCRPRKIAFVLPVLPFDPRCSTCAPRATRLISHPHSATVGGLVLVRPGNDVGPVLISCRPRAGNVRGIGLVLVCCWSLAGPVYDIRSVLILIHADAAALKWFVILAWSLRLASTGFTPSLPALGSRCGLASCG